MGQQEFVALMGKVLAAAGHIPRSYLLPSQVRSDYEPPTFQPQLTARSRVSALPRAPHLDHMLQSTTAIQHMPICVMCKDLAWFLCLLLLHCPVCSHTGCAPAAESTAHVAALALT